MLRGIPAPRAFNVASKARVTTARKLHTQRPLTSGRANAALTVTSSALVAGALWYAFAQAETIHNDAPPVADALEARPVDTSSRTVLEDAELSMLVWGSNK